MTKKILIIDDEKRVCDVVKAGLEKMGDFDVITAQDGKTGIKMARKNKPDLVLLDVRLPDIDGVAILKDLKGDAGTHAIPVIMLTAVMTESTKLECAFEYSDRYLEKPIDLDVLKSKIEQVLKPKPI